jgi:DNA-binding NtrC family response regulator
VVTLEVPPLRQRPGDVALLFRHFLAKYSEQSRQMALKLSDSAAEILAMYSWPGNVRQLQNIARRAVALADGPLLQPEDVYRILPQKEQQKAALGSFNEAKNKRTTEFERNYFDSLLRTTQGNVEAASKIAGLPRGSIYRLLKKTGLSADDYRTIEGDGERNN